MASITNSLFPPINARPNTRAETPFPFAPAPNRKRRPVDPPEEGPTFHDSEYYASPYNVTSLSGTVLGAQSPNKRMRTVDNFLDTLTLRASDPPGHYSKCVGDLGSNAMTGDYAMCNNHTQNAKPVTSNGIEPSYHAIMATNDASTSCASTVTTANKRPKATQDQSYRQLKFNNEAQLQYYQRGHSTSGISGTGNSEMSLEGSDIDADDDGSIDSSSSSESVSESSIRKAMYQVVFGRRMGYSSCAANGHCAGGRIYDAVDSKIEDLIRRSRLEAVIRSSKEKREKRKEDESESVEKGMDLD
ncbi:hypothetical protein ACHAWX_005977 [Stephanocyclus meneghinianus]